MKTQFRSLAVLGIFLGLASIMVAPVLAHVVVRPNEVGVAARTNFVVSVPTEEDVPTTGVRLVIPEGLKSVRPNVKPGWEIEISRDPADATRVTEIIWSGGSIPAEQRDEFVFSAQAPGEESELIWKAYQTYQGGKVVEWDQSPEVMETYMNNTGSANHDDPAAPKPYSVTVVKNDLSPAGHEMKQDKIWKFEKLDFTTLVLSVGAFLMSSIALWKTEKKRSSR